jgi:hypothetical protein
MRRSGSSFLASNAAIFSRTRGNTYPSDDAAIREFLPRVERGDFQPDANVTPMQRTL